MSCTIVTILIIIIITFIIIIIIIITIVDRLLVQSFRQSWLQQETQPHLHQSRQLCCWSVCITSRYAIFIIIITIIIIIINIIIIIIIIITRYSILCGAWHLRFEKWQPSVRRARRQGTVLSSIRRTKESSELLLKIHMSTVYMF